MSEHTSLNIAIFGAGSIGCYVGGQLASTGAQVTFLGRSSYQKALTENGLTLTHFSKDPLIIPASGFAFTLSPKDIAGADIILVCVKSQDSAEAARAILQHARPDAVVISFQNGVGNSETLQEILPDHIVLGAVVPFNVTGKGAGVFHSGTDGELTIEARPNPLLTDLQNAFQAAGQGCILSDDIKAVQWGKLLVNLNNALNTLSGGTLYEGLIQRNYRKSMADMVEEAYDVLKGAGITPAPFGQADPEKMIKTLRLPNIAYKTITNSIVKIDKRARSSMLDDLEAGRAPEIDYLQGEIVKLARKTQQSAPINQAILDKVKAVFKTGNSPNLSGKEIYKIIQAAKS